MCRMLRIGDKWYPSHLTQPFTVIRNIRFIRYIRCKKEDNPLTKPEEAAMYDFEVITKAMYSN